MAIHFNLDELAHRVLQQRIDNRIKDVVHLELVVFLCKVSDHSELLVSSTNK
jgi:hypothetical protein